MPRVDIVLTSEMIVKARFATWKHVLNKLYATWKHVFNLLVI